MKSLIMQHTDNDYVASVVIGDSPSEDRTNGFLMPVFQQVDMVCDMVKNDPKLQNGYHGLGFSQGSQFLRAVAQRCPEPPMVNLVTIDGQHQGVFGFPGCPPDNIEFCETLRELLEIAYVPAIQSTLVQAQYWHDPVQVDLHRRESQFIGPINNEMRDGLPHNEEYKTNLNKLENLVMCMGERDITVIPRETAHFGYYAYGQKEDVIPLEETEVWTQNQLGLQTMKEAGKLHFRTHSGGHMNFSDNWFIETCIPWLQ